MINILILLYSFALGRLIYITYIFAEEDNILYTVVCTVLRKENDIYIFQ